MCRTRYASTASPKFLQKGYLFAMCCACGARFRGSVCIGSPTISTDDLNIRMA